MKKKTKQQQHHTKKTQNLKTKQTDLEIKMFMFSSFDHNNCVNFQLISFNKMFYSLYLVRFHVYD